jgi:hypothetical protein
LQLQQKLCFLKKKTEMVLQKSGFDVLKGGSNPFHDGNKNNRLDKKNI